MAEIGAQKKKISISFLGNCFYDTRVTNLVSSFKKEGCIVSVTSFDWFIDSCGYYKNGIKVFKLKKGRIRILFYLSFAFKLIRELIKSDADIFLAEDVYTLPFVTLIGKLKKGKIIYNSRELYAFIGGLRNRPVIQFMVKTIEKFFIKKVDLVLTTGEMDSQFLEKFYSINNTLVLRNVPMMQKPSEKVDFRKMFNIPPDKVIMLYQGVLLNGRGITMILKAMPYIPDAVFIILGGGEQRKNFENIGRELNIDERVFFTGAIDQEKLINYTAGADFGLAIIENISISYFHALPHKIFEYIMADLPVLASDLPQMKKIVEMYNVGAVINAGKEECLVNKLKEWVENPSLLDEFRMNCRRAAEELNWQSEFDRCKNRILE